MPDKKQLQTKSFRILYQKRCIDCEHIYIYIYSVASSFFQNNKKSKLPIELRAPKLHTPGFAGAPDPVVHIPRAAG